MGLFWAGWGAIMINRIRSKRPKMRIFLHTSTNGLRNYFWSLIQAVRQQIIPLLKEILTLIPTIDTVVTTGHSLGGALAVLCAFDLALVFKENSDMGMLKIPNRSSFLKMNRKIKCITFGAPRVGDFTFRKKFHNEVGIENCIQGNIFNYIIIIYISYDMIKIMQTGDNLKL